MNSDLIVILLFVCLFLAMVSSVGAAQSSGADTITFAPQRQAIKIVPGIDGSDVGDYAGRVSLIVAHLKDLGVDLTRVGISWGETEAVRGKYDWTIPDEMVNFLTDRDIEPLIVLFGAPAWARTTHPDDEKRDKELEDVIYPELDLPRDEFAADYERWAEAVAKRYRGRVRLYEFWNEPDGIPGPVLLRDKTGKLLAGHTGGDPVRYAKFLKVAYKGLKRGNPDAKLAAGSLSVYDTDFLKAIYTTIGRGHFDAVSFHPYNGDGIYTPWTEDVRRTCVRYGDPGCELWLTEYDWNAVRNRPDKTTTYGQGAVMETVPSDGISLGSHYPYATQLYLHTLNDWSASNSPLPWEGFGLLNLELKPKPKYEEYRKSLLWRRLTQAREQILCGPHIAFPEKPFEIYIEPTMVKNVGEVEWFVPEGWKVESLGSGRFIFTAPAKSACALPYALSAKNRNGVTFTRYVEVIEPVQLAYSIVKQGACEGVPAVVESVLYNISSEPVDVTLRFNHSGGCKSDKQAITLLPGKETKVESKIAFNPGTRSGNYSLESVVLIDEREVGHYRFESIFEASASASTKRIDGDISDWGNDGWVLIAGNASPARFKTAWDDKAFYIACIVDDEKHVQTQNPKHGWKEDSIQIGIDAFVDGVPGGSLTSDDFEWLFMLKDGKPANYRHHAPKGLYGGEVDNIDLAVKRSEGRTVYEIGIPWSELAPLKPEAGSSFGFEIVINDSDGTDRQSSMWTHGIADGKRPVRFGRVRLVE